VWTLTTTGSVKAATHSDLRLFFSCFTIWLVFVDSSVPASASLAAGAEQNYFGHRRRWQNQLIPVTVIVRTDDKLSGRVWTIFKLMKILSLLFGAKRCPRWRRAPRTICRFIPTGLTT